MNTPAVKIPFDNTYLQLADTLYSRQMPTAVEAPELIRVNEPLAERLQIDPAQLKSIDGVAVLAGNLVPPGAEPIATAYAGHQFGSWNPQLGDGRAILLGEVIGIDGLRYDVQLKGAGPTPYSRMGDGRSPLGPVLREYIVSEAMAALGVPTTRSLAAVTTGERVVRDQLLPGAILTRVARSHIRVGTFQYFAARQDMVTVQKLADHVIDRHYSEAAQAENPYCELLIQVVKAQAKLIAQWQALGFIHGVMNTDNMLVGGETVDYGPCAFMENYDPETVFSSIDHGGRYAYINQAPIARWNLAWLAQSLLPLLDASELTGIKRAEAALDLFISEYEAHYQQYMSQKIGVVQADDVTNQLVDDFLALMQQNRVDFTLGFRVLADEVTPAVKGEIASFYALPDAFQGWLESWRQYLALDQRSAAEVRDIRRRMNATNPVFIPRNHQIEAAIQAGNQGNFKPFHQLLEVLADPFKFDPDKQGYALPATPEQRVLRTFCGT